MIFDFLLSSTKKISNYKHLLAQGLGAYEVAQAVKKSKAVFFFDVYRSKS